MRIWGSWDASVERLGDLDNAVLLKARLTSETSARTANAARQGTPLTRMFKEGMRISRELEIMHEKYLTNNSMERLYKFKSLRKSAR